MEVICVVLIVFAAFVGLSVVACVAVVFFVRMRSRQPLNLNLRFLLRNLPAGGDPGGNAGVHPGGV